MNRTLWCIWAIALGSGCVTAQDTPPDLTHVLAVLRSHVERLESSVPNFVCKEQIVSRYYEGEKVKKETGAMAVLTTTRSTREGHGTFSESRAEMHINGKASKRNQISGPFVWQGGPAYGDLHFLFNSDHGMECRSYNLAGNVQLESRSVLLLEVHAASNRRDICHDLPDDSADKVWLDPQSLNVVRIESFNPPTSGSPGATQGSTLTLTVEYAAVTFDGAEYWLPTHFISRIDFPGLPKHFQYEAFFTDYHKYGAESVVHIDAEQ